MGLDIVHDRGKTDLVEMHTVAVLIRFGQISVIADKRGIRIQIRKSVCFGNLYDPLIGGLNFGIIDRALLKRVDYFASRYC